ncbi:MAG: cyclopropane-fatty-acyl-phospholipid synthase family protein [Actinomycetota bacterium]
MKTQTVVLDSHAETTLNFFQHILQDYQLNNFAIRLWDGTVWSPGTTEEPRFTLVLKHAEALRNMFLNVSDLTLGEAYIFDDFDIEGDIEAAYQVAEWMIDQGISLTDKARLGHMLLKLPARQRTSGSGSAAGLSGETHSRERDRQAINYHYDVSNDFYSLWLDKNMVYSCAYFATPSDDIDTAQEQKLDYICRKLRLKPGERLLDIGCGWGGLVMFAVREYGVIAEGVTLSESQAELANQLIREAGLTDRCRVNVRDYRDLNDENGYDKLVSVGMFEHVGSALLRTYFKQAFRLLKPGGVFLNHGIASCIPIGEKPKLTGPTFFSEYVFPDGELTNVSKSLTEAELAGFEVRDVESLREHYALTLRNWVSRLEDSRDAAVRETDETTYRIWRLFMSASAYGFRTDRINVYQALLAKPDKGGSGLPLRRADWYA